MNLLQTKKVDHFFLAHATRIHQRCVKSAKLAYKRHNSFTNQQKTSIRPP